MITPLLTIDNNKFINCDLWRL